MTTTFGPSLRQSCGEKMRRISLWFQSQNLRFFLLLAGILVGCFFLYHEIHYEEIAYSMASGQMERRQAGLVAQRVHLLAAQLENHPEKLRELAGRLADSGQNASALYLYRVAAERSPPSNSAARRHASLLWSTGEGDRAVSVLENAADGGLPWDAETLELLLALYLATGKPERVVEELESRSALVSRNLALAGLFARGLVDTGNHREGLKIYRDILAREPLNRSIRLEYARALSAAALKDAKEKAQSFP
jgi:hypothetical protein